MTKESSDSTTSSGVMDLLNDVEHGPLHFPPKHNNGKADCGSGCCDGGGCEDVCESLTFVQACRLAAESHQPLHLSQDIADLSETIVLRKRQRLSIVGRPSPLSSEPNQQQPSSAKTTKRTKIAGKLHSLFLLNNHSELELSNLELVHLESDGDDCRNVGASVNLRYKSKARLENCFVASHSGFCCWAVQKASICLRDCWLEAPLRSAVVCFGRAEFVGNSCTVSNAGVHGVCARGECSIKLVDSSIVDAAVRGLYAYANASVWMDGCTVKGTVRPDTAAIEVLSAAAAAAATKEEQASAGAARPKSGNNKKKKKPHNNSNNKKVLVDVVPEKASSLTMTGCKVIDNAGVGVRIRGGVRHNLHPDNISNHFSNNSGGDGVDFCPASTITSEEKTVADTKSSGEQERTITTTNTNNNGGDPKNSSSEYFRRDASGSSFRKGDWWCLKCVPKSIVHGSKDSCPRCNSSKIDGKLLSSEEVIQLNRGGGLLMAPVAATITPTWWFDGDDAGWLPYDTESNKKLERAFQSLCHLSKRSPGDEVDERNPSQSETSSTSTSSSIVFLSNGRYRVNLETMEQINTDSHFLRLIQRRESETKSHNIERQF